jgi:hypothetical protein
MKRLAGTVLSGLILAGCGLLGSEIVVEAVNDSDQAMVVQVVDSNGAPHGPAHRIEPLGGREVELAVPGGDWVVTVNGARLMDSSDAAGRRGRLPVTLILPAPDDPIQGPRWQAPEGWAGAGG